MVDKFEVTVNADGVVYKGITVHESFFKWLEQHQTALNTNGVDCTLAMGGRDDLDNVLILEKAIFVK